VWQVGLEARGVALSLVCLVCVFITLWVAIGAGNNKNYETPTPVSIHLYSFLPFPHYPGQYWCWISPRFHRERIGGEYVWMWIALIVSAILYIPLYFWAEGFWSVDEEDRFHWSDPNQRAEYAQRRATYRMLL
jgi:hypothetical protein